MKIDKYLKLSRDQQTVVDYYETREPEFKIMTSTYIVIITLNVMFLLMYYMILQEYVDLNNTHLQAITFWFHGAVAVFVIFLLIELIEYIVNVFYHGRNKNKSYKKYEIG